MNIKVNIHNPLYNLLVEHKFRWLRHVILILSVVIIVLNYIYGTYKGNAETLNLYAISGIYMVVYLLVVYLNIYCAIPKLLLKKKYAEYILIFFGTSLFIPIGHISADYLIHAYYKIPYGSFSIFPEERNPFFIYLLYNVLSTLFYLTSVSSIVLYKYWMLNIIKVERLKAEQFNSELNNLKNRVSPDFLFDKLRKAGDYCFITPQYTSRILLQLGRILRYQLYDSSRKEVLLNSEIKYLNDYLGLEKLSNDKFDFKISQPRSTINCLIPPLLFISFVENSLKKLSGQDGHTRINIEFGITDSVLIFNITDNRNMTDIQDNIENKLLIYNRLSLIEKDKYSLSSEKDKGSGQYKTVFQFELSSGIV